MDILQDALNEATTALPALFLQKQISKKLREQGIKRTKGLAEKLAKHILKGNREPIEHPRNITITFTKADADEIEQAIEHFCDTQFPTIIPDLARRTSKTVLKDLRCRWPNEYVLQNKDVLDFRERLEDRWARLSVYYGCF